MDIKSAKATEIQKTEGKREDETGMALMKAISGDGLGGISDADLKKIKSYLMQTYPQLATKKINLKEIINEFRGFLRRTQLGDIKDRVPEEGVEREEIKVYNSIQMAQPSQPRVDDVVKEQEEYVRKTLQQLPLTPVNWEKIEMRMARERRAFEILENQVRQKQSTIIREPPKPIHYVNVNDVYIFQSCLKRSEHCTVNKYYSKKHKKNVAIKCISKIKLSLDQLMKFHPREIQICLQLKHPHIVQYLETFQNGLKIYLVMEYVKEGSLTKYINERGRLDAVVYRKIFCQLTKVVSFLMEQEIYHRKICCDNILVTTRNDIKLCDFSFARYADRDRRLYDTFCGVVAFTAPEILLCKPYSPELSEVWSIGVVVYSMVYGALPFNPTHHAQLIKQITTPIKFKTYSDTPCECINLMHNMIAPVESRYSLKTVMSDPWLFHQNPLLHVEERWPGESTTSYLNLKDKLQQLKGTSGEEIMSIISDCMSKDKFEKLRRMRMKKIEENYIPEKLKWLFTLQSE